MWKKIKEFNDWYIENKNVFEGVFKILVIGFVLLCFAITLKNTFKQASELVTPMTKQQAETPAEVEKAASNAHIKLDSGQTNQVSENIREIRVTEKEPVYIIQTTGDKAQEASEKASKQEKADFSIVTDKDHPDEAVELDKLDKNETVNLNQYNIQAYKKQLNTIEYQPWEKTIGYTHSWKVSKSGRYMGVGLDYDTDDNRVTAKVTYSW
nr:MAG TPA: hypothetical protein [Caudoviricetes sp.]